MSAALLAAPVGPSVVCPPSNASGAETILRGVDCTPRVGRYVEPDLWAVGDVLRASEWDRAPFRLKAPVAARSALAVRVEVTGRAPQLRPGGFRAVRVRVTFVGDGEPDQHAGAWMSV